MDWYLYDNGPRHERVNRIFDELNEVKYFTGNNRFQESFNLKYFKT